MRLKQTSAVLVFTFVLAGCSMPWQEAAPTQPAKPENKTDKSETIPKRTAAQKHPDRQDDIEKYQSFRKRVNLRKSYKVYENKRLLASSRPQNTKVVIDVSEQRARLLVDGVVAYDTPCTTGSKHKFEPNTKIYRDKRTPYGTFKILEKIKTKRSTIFGRYYRGKRCVYRGDRRKCRLNKKNLRYEGAPLFYWQRLTRDGIGMHESKYIKRHPGTNGCIRLPKKAAKLFFAKTRIGGTVVVQP